MPFDYNINWPFHYLFMIFFAVFGLVLLTLDRRRRGAYAKAAKALALDYRRREDESTAFLRGRFAFFRSGAIDSVSSVLRGTFKGWDIAAFNYWFQSADSVKSFRHGFLCLIVKKTGGFPAALMIPKSLRDELAGGRQALDGFFDPALTENHLVFGRDGRAVQRLLDAETLGVVAGRAGTVLETGEAGLLLAIVGELKPETLAEDLEGAIALAAHMTASLADAKPRSRRPRQTSG